MKTILTILALLLSLSVISAQQYWNEVPSGTTYHLNSISFGSENVGYIGGNDSLILKTVDGGKTWNALTFSGVDFSSIQGLTDIIHIEFINETEGYIAVNDADTLGDYTGRIYNSIDGGATWVLESPNLCAPIRTYHFDADNGYAIGSSCFNGKIVSKKDNGFWNSSSSFSWGNDYLRAIDFYNPSQGMVGGDGPQIYRTFDAGITWDTINLTIPDFGQGGQILDIKYIDENTVILASNTERIDVSISYDKGLTWTHHNSVSFASPRIKSVVYSRKDSIVAVGSAYNGNNGDIIWYDENGGYYREFFFPSRLNMVRMMNDSIAYAVGENGLIITNNTFTTSVFDLESKVPSAKVFPNPSFDTITVEAENMKLIELVSLEGKRLKTYRVKGKAQKSLDISHLGSGLYLIKVRFNNGQIRCEKITVH